ncbi:hypothetical protein QNI16_36265 [Cytophagaceae bacterium YF14B1]|uniref:Uncharacterized protein n=1 Tax=Xanthocytophaga flava TaxID=3048013 RepID=A0AAE3R0R4_9BACT|nr:hypothetical protein [Xanthocytophaga flavus]MDJ1485993.1 hypothetical protein [Xanthocytophaga flavus]
MSQDSNNLIFLTLDKIHRLSSPKVSMWPGGNKYSYIPFLPFRFEGEAPGNLIYEKLKEVIRTFEGNIKWIMLDNKPPGKNYIIKPELAASFKLDRILRKEVVVDFLDEEAYYLLIDKAVEDIPALARHIEEKFTSTITTTHTRETLE